MSDVPADPRRSELASRFLVSVLVGIFLLGLLGFFVAVLSAGDDDPEATAAAEGAARVPRIVLTVAAASALPGVEPMASADAAPTVEPDPSPEATVETDAGLGAVASPMAEHESIDGPRLAPVVPVARFWSKRTGIAQQALRSALENGKVAGFKRVIVEDRVRAGLADALGIELHPDVRSGSVAAVERAVRRGALGFMAATDVSPRVRALAIAGQSLFGNDRLEDAASWPLSVPLPTDVPSDTWEQAETWVLVAGGDAFTDRGVYDNVVRKGRGVDFPFGGGTARVTGHGCCDPVFNDNVVPRYQLTGNKGLVRRLFKEAELAIANHEAPVTEDWAFHRSGLRFSGRPDLTRIFTRAGIDWVSLANNHIKDYGTDGIRDTRRILRKHGIAFGGAGRDLQQARRISYLDVGETRVAIIPCVGVAPFAWAGKDTSGGTPCKDGILVPDIRKASREADVVIVFPHWGVEYTRRPVPSMRKQARKWVRAGADLVLGGHSHVAGAIEEIDGSPVLYSLGNLIFDQHWSTNTMESALVEATFQGDRLAQVSLRPYIIHAQSQPNLLDPAKGEGRRLIDQIRNASKAWLDW